MRNQRGLSLPRFLFVVAALATVYFVGHDIFGSGPQAERAAKRKAEEHQREEDRKPRKVSEANGCEVWAFNPGGRWQYFTRCGASTETTNIWEECRSVASGKTTRTECIPHSMTVTQEPKQ